MPHSPESIEIAKARDLLRNGGLVVFPTETVYGLGADACNSIAVKRIFEVKGRPAQNPLIIHLAKVEQITHYGDLTKTFNPTVVRERLNRLSRFWPGPLSVVLPRGPELSPLISGGGESAAFRIPKHPVALALLEAFRGPVAAPSANPSQYISPTTAAHVAQSLGSRVDLILDGGSCEIGLESTVISLIEEVPVLLRPGAVTRETLSEVLGVPVVSRAALNEDATDALPSPGLMLKHYAPKTKVRLVEGSAPDLELTGRIGCIRFTSTPPPYKAEENIILSDSGDLTKIAHGLFAALRSLDQLGLDLIVVDTCERTGLGEAIMDRLQRASA